MDIFSWQRGMRNRFMMELSMFVADIEKTEVVPLNKALERQLLKTPAVCDSSEFSAGE